MELTTKYFREQDGSVWGFEKDGSQDEFISETMVAMTPAEVELHLNPPPTREHLIEVESLWRAEQMPVALDNVTAIEFGETGIAGTSLQWKSYWLALRKWTTDNPDFPETRNRPVAPS